MGCRDPLKEEEMTDFSRAGVAGSRGIAQGAQGVGNSENGLLAEVKT